MRNYVDRKGLHKYHLENMELIVVMYLLTITNTKKSIEIDFSQYQCESSRYIFAVTHVL